MAKSACRVIPITSWANFNVIETFYHEGVYCRPAQQVLHISPPPRSAHFNQFADLLTKRLFPQPVRLTFPPTILDLRVGIGKKWNVSSTSSSRQGWSNYIGIVKLINVAFQVDSISSMLPAALLPCRLIALLCCCRILESCNCDAHCIGCLIVFTRIGMLVSVLGMNVVLQMVWALVGPRGVIYRLILKVYRIFGGDTSPVCWMAVEIEHQEMANPIAQSITLELTMKKFEYQSYAWKTTKRQDPMHGRPCCLNAVTTQITSSSILKQASIALKKFPLCHSAWTRYTPWILLSADWIMKRSAWIW